MYDLDIDRELVKRIVEGLRKELHLDLFGIDLIICEMDKLAVIDVNIFPGN